MKTSAFQQAIEAVEGLSLEDQKILIDIIQKRLHQQQRTQLFQEIREIRQEFRKKNVQFGSVDDFLTQLDQHEDSLDS